MWQNKKIIVTMTSWKARIDQVDKVLESVLKQTIQPDLVYLNLSLSEFRVPILTKKLTELVNKHKKKIRVIWLKGENTKAFKKMLPILNYLDDEDIVIDIDDDGILPEKLIESRLEDFEKYNTCISGFQPKINGYGEGLLPEMRHYVGPATLYQKKMLKNWEKLLCREIINTNHDDAFYDFLVYLNGYLPKACSKYPAPSFTKINIGTPALHGSIGCAKAGPATKINVKRFEEVFHDHIKFNYFNTNKEN